MSELIAIRDKILESNETNKLFIESQKAKLADLKKWNGDLQNRVEDLEANRSSPGKTSSGNTRTREFKALSHFMRTGDATELQPPETKEILEQTCAWSGWATSGPIG